MLRHIQSHLSGRAGFTLPEIILVVIVMAILMTVSMPVLYQFVQRKDMQSEENTQLEIRKALQAYLQEKNKLPGADTWSTDLAGYTNLSADQIANDTWRRPRAYITYTDPTRQLQGSTVEVYYVTILSMGGNGEADGADGVAVSGKSYAAADDDAWWSRKAGQEVAKFSSLKAGGDDVLLRFTDYPEKIERYNLTLQRLDRIAQALEAYAKNGYANKVVACSTLPKDVNGVTGDATCDNGAPEKIVYYPRATAIANQADGATYYNTTTYVNNNQSDANRRANMQNLMRLLGLPDEFCCSALALGSDDQPRPFYYFSNPRPRNAGGGCAGRPGVADVKLPARLSTTNDDTAASNPTCG